MIYCFLTVVIQSIAFFFQTKVSVQEFKEHVPLIQTICNKGLRDRHWNKLAEVVGFPLKPDDVSCVVLLLKA